MTKSLLTRASSTRLIRRAGISTTTSKGGRAGSNRLRLFRRRVGRPNSTKHIFMLFVVFISAIIAGFTLLALGTYIDYKTPVKLISPISGFSFPIPSPTSTPKPLPIKQEVEREIRSVFGEHADSALIVARCESGLNPKAKNSQSTARGTFQIIIGTWEGYDCDGKRTDFKSNIACAYKIFKKNGYRFNTSGGWAASYSCHKQK